MKKLKRNKKGFTLIEMIVVIVIVAILAAISVPAVMKYIDEARNTKLIAKGDGIKVTFQADLAKLVAKGNGKIGATDLKTASESAIKASGEDDSKTTIQACTEDVKETATKCTAPATDTEMNTIKSYVVKFDSSYVYIPSDGAAFVTKTAPADK